MDIYNQYRDPRGCLKTFGVILFIIIYFTIIFCLSSCKTLQQPTVLNNNDITERTEKEILRDTIIKTEPDSASITALLACDSLNNVLLQQLDVQAGNRIKPSINITPNKDGSVNIEFDCKEDSLLHEIQLRDKMIETLKQQKQEVPVYVEKPQSQFLRNSGIALWVLIALFVIAVIIGIVIKFAK